MALNAPAIGASRIMEGSAVPAFQKSRLESRALAASFTFHFCLTIDSLLCGQL